MYQNLDADHKTLFPNNLSSNKKNTSIVSFDKVPGRNEHGHNLDRRKVQKKGTSMLLNIRTISPKAVRKDNMIIL